MQPELMRTIRKNANMTQEVFAKILGVRQSMVAMQETGEREISREHATAVLNAFSRDYIDFCRQLQKITEIGNIENTLGGEMK